MPEKYYVYEHIRTDTNKTFYVGIGSIRHLSGNDNTIYERAYNVTERNKIWNLITKKTTFNVKIVFASNDRDIVKDKEISLIEKYGRIIKKTGTLCNITRGGDWNSFEGTTVYMYKLNGDFVREFINSRHAQQMTDIDCATIRTCCNKSTNRMSGGGYLWSYDKHEKIQPYVHPKKKKLHQYDLKKNYIDSHESILEACNKTGIKIRKANPLSKTFGGYYFLYEDEDFPKLKKHAPISKETYKDIKFDISQYNSKSKCAMFRYLAEKYSVKPQAIKNIFYNKTYTHYSAEY